MIPAKIIPRHIKSRFPGLPNLSPSAERALCFALYCERESGLAMRRGDKFNHTRLQLAARGAWQRFNLFSRQAAN